MVFVAPASADTASSSEWSLSGRSSYQNNASTPGAGSGGRSIVTAGGVSRSAVLPSSVTQIRPMTGLARVGDRSGAGASSTPHRVVESVGHYQSMLRAKIEEIVQEIDRLRSEIADGDSESRKALESKYDDMSKVVQRLEGNLADYNLAKEQSRSGNGPEDIRRSTRAIVMRNEKMEKEIDKIFFSRKEAEEEIVRMEAELEQLHASVESKFRDGGDPDKVEEYRALVKDFESLVAETKQEEDDVILIRHKIKTMDPSNNGQGKEQKSRAKSLKKQLEEVEDKLLLAHMNEDEAREHLLNKVLDDRCHAKELATESSRMQSEIQALHEVQKELRSERRTRLSDGAAGAYERLLKKDHEAKRCLEELPEAKAKLEEEHSRLAASIKALRSEIDERKSRTTMDLPSKEEVELMKDEVVFTGKHLDANQETIALLQQQKQSRMEELERMGTLEDRIKAEMEELEKQTVEMTKDIQKYNNVDALQYSVDATRDYLGEMAEKYMQQIELLDRLLKKSETKYQQKVEQLEGSSEWKEVQELKSKLRIQGQEIFELQETVSSAKARAAYGKVKDDCLEQIRKINRCIISQKQ